MLLSMKRSFVFSIVISLSLVLAACSVATDVVTSRFSVQLEPSELVISPGGSAVTNVSIAPLTGFELAPGNAVITLNNPPVWLEAEPLTIPGNVRELALTLRAAPDAPVLAEPLSVTVVATKPSSGDTTTLELTVTEPDTP